MQHYGRLDQQIFNEFQADRERLHQIANRIRATVQDEDLTYQLYQMEEEEDWLPLWEVREGKVLYKLHKHRERNRAIVREKKAQFLKDHKRLYCEACTFNFEQRYGSLGKSYIECHHRTPLAAITADTVTQLRDLALVCANCHRMLHRGISYLSVEGLREVVAAN